MSEIEENPLAMKSGDIFPKRCTKIHKTFAESLTCVDCQSVIYTNREKSLLSHISTLEEKIGRLEILLVNTRTPDKKEYDPTDILP
jgi:hypothetical protein